MHIFSNFAQILMSMLMPLYVFRSVLKLRHTPGLSLGNLVFFSLLLLLFPLFLAAQNTDSWVATDGLGRVMPTFADSPLKTDRQRTVGIFYVTWHTQNFHNGKPYRFDIERIARTKEGDPDHLSLQQHHGQWFHWGEPEYGYFLSQDRYVIRHDLMMLADAGVDVLILDVTNAVHYWDEWEALFQTMQQMRAEGNRVPQFCFWAFNGEVTSVVQSLYERYYKTSRYQDCWFYWQGKPLLLYNADPDVDANNAGGGKGKKDYSDEVKRFFTLRNMWWGYYEWAGKRFVGTEGNWSFGYQLDDANVARLSPKELCATNNGRPEQFAVTPAQHPINIVGKSWSRKGGEPALNERDMPTNTLVPWLGKEVEDPTPYGIYFQERWDEALQADPDFIYLNDWNEWTAICFKTGIDPAGNQGGPATFLNRQSPFYFVDQYNAEFCRTIAPMRGGFTDNYYMQMVQNIRRYKGVAEIPMNKGYRKIRIDGNFSDWTSEGLVDYEDTRGDVEHRNHKGYGDHHYTDTSGRNDILLSRVAADKKHLHFYVRTAQPLTPHTDPHWMLLFIDADCNARTGWEGYEYMVNYLPSDASHTTLMAYDAEKEEWKHVALLPYAVSGNEMELSVPRKLLGKYGQNACLDFKWADNPADLNHIISLCTHGDTAPNRRFNYRYLWTP